ncbi:TPA: hypothetical protein HA219_03500 [Candidatus Woesearchaeota archaeon]|nr:hypothetical protein [uncultured archaeon]AQS32040.1 hypothetical protein [uncultured archaeon]MBS3115233.1 hypothetical protein [Candidatus Woesearchaeota archaeon]HIH39759.1 hypothetical protein [Candidatus Woesearchaeota archaeon]
MNRKIASIFIIVLFFNISLAFAAKDTPEYKKAEAYIANIEKPFAGVMSDPNFIDGEYTAALTLAVAKLMKSQTTKLKELNPSNFPEIVKLDKEVRASLKNAIKKYNLNDEAIQEILKKKESAIPASLFDINVHKKPILYASSGFPWYVAYPIYVLLFLLLFNLFRMSINPDARNWKSFFGSGLFGWIAKKTKEDLLETLNKFNPKKLMEKKKIEEFIEKHFGDRETAVNQNQQKFNELIEMLKINGKIEPAKLNEQATRDLLKVWLNTEFKILENTDEVVKEDVKKYLAFLSEFESGFGTSLIKSYRKDTEKLEALKKMFAGRTISYAAKDIQDEVDKIKNNLRIEVELINTNYYPHINELGNNIRKIKGLLKLDEKLIGRLKSALSDLSTGRVRGKTLIEDLEIIKICVEKVDENSKEGKELAKKVKEMNELLGGIEQKISEKQKEAIKSMIEVRNFAQRRRLFSAEKAKWPLPVKSQGYPSGDEIISPFELKKRIMPAHISLFAKQSLQNEAVFEMVKEKGGKSELYDWFSDAVEYEELARKIQELINEANLPQVITKSEYNEIIRKLTRLRQRIAEAIENAYQGEKYVK